MDKLIDLIHDVDAINNWDAKVKEAFDELFTTRYKQDANKNLTYRHPSRSNESSIPYAAMIDSSNPNSGPYGGMSFVLFPSDEDNENCLVAMGIGTQGLHPDQDVLGKPGHSRKINAVCDWLNSEYGGGVQIAWAKSDPVRTDIDMPETVQRNFSEYTKTFKKYGNVLYGIFSPNDDREITTKGVTALLDIFFAERGNYVRAAFLFNSEEIKNEYYAKIMPDQTKEKTAEILNSRRYIILQGPPGTGKTRMAINLIQERYNGNGESIQFHPNTTYEDFIGGLAPVQTDDQIGFKFKPQKGFLLNAIEMANEIAPSPYLLHIDEINRADLSKVLGEAIFLFEHNSEETRKIELIHDFGVPFEKKAIMPSNLHILGTMNSSDRSIAILDIAVRRRFAFIDLWPNIKVVEQNGCSFMVKAFKQLLEIFIEHAPEEMFNLIPGHSYFLIKDEDVAKEYLKLNLIPLLEEYIAQGYVSSFGDYIKSYIQWLKSF